MEPILEIPRQLENNKLPDKVLQNHTALLQNTLRNARFLPAELQLEILANAFIPRARCVQHYFEMCNDPWSCRCFFEHGEPTYIPDSKLTSVSTFWRDEGLKNFFTYNFFIFNRTTNDLNQPSSEEATDVWPGEDLRDPHATRLLDFVDRPDWKDRGGRMFRENWSYPSHLIPHVDRYRHLIRQMALIFRPIERTDTQYGDEEILADWDWSWPLKVDWSTLPHLQTLYIDLRAFPHFDTPLSQIHSVIDCADRMECLKLKKLVLVVNNTDLSLQADTAGIGLISAEKALRRLFEPALGPESGNVIEFLVDHSREW